jgi:hypothetical protein
MLTSVAQESLSSQIEHAFRQVLCEAAERLARSTGLIRRQGKITGANFAQTLILGWLANPDASLEMLAQFASEVGLHITAQGLDERFTGRAVAFLQALWEVALAQVVVADPVAIPLLERFAAVCLEDSTVIGLPDELAEVFRGCGGHHEGHQSSCKLFVRLDMLRGQLTCSTLQDGRCADGRTPLKQVPTPARTLHIRDRGFTDVWGWLAEQEQEQLVLTYLRSDLQIFDRQGQSLDLLRWLSQAGPSGEVEVRVGDKQRVAMRLLFERVPPQIAQERRRRLRREARTQGRHLSHRVDLLAGWTLALTTVATELLSLEEALVLLRLRWQIELLFKLWKERGLLDEWRTTNPQRILCELYAKLLGLLLQHWVLLLGCWQQPHRSLVKAAKVVREHVVLLAAVLAGDLSWQVALRRTSTVMQAGSRLNTRRDAPNTSQLLLSRCNQWGSKPLRKRRLK